MKSLTQPKTAIAFICLLSCVFSKAFAQAAIINFIDSNSQAWYEPYLNLEVNITDQEISTRWSVMPQRVAVDSPVIVTVWIERRKPIDIVYVVIDRDTIAQYPKNE